MNGARGDVQAFDKVSVVGLGYVGLPLAHLLVTRGYSVTGIDIDAGRIQNLLSGTSYLSDMTDDDVRYLIETGRFSCQTSFDTLPEADAIIICVPTPLDEQRRPDLSYTVAATENISAALRPGQLIVLESSTFPGTTDEVLVPILERTGLRAGEDFYVAYSPERINPGDDTPIHTIPKVLGGYDERSARLARILYDQLFDRVVLVSSTRVAEFTKLLENTQRFVNISLMNELMMLCQLWGIDIWEAIDVASTKPHGFMAYRPGPGIGGHCIPVDPLYLSWKANESGSTIQLIQASDEINRLLPRYVVDRITSLVNTPALEVLIIGLAYKRNVNDLRESPALEIIKLLTKRSARVTVHDPLIAEATIDGKLIQSSSLTAALVEAADIVVILTDHSRVDYALIASHAKLVLDTRAVMKRYEHGPNIVYL